MSRLMEILGRGMEVDTSDLIWQWLQAVNHTDNNPDQNQTLQLENITQLAINNKTRQAKEQLKLYLFENSACAKGRMAAAAFFLADNQIKNAVEELNSVYFRQPSNTMALYALGHCYERLQKEEQAIEFYQDCLKFKNYLLLPRYRLAALYFKKLQIDKTINEYKLLTNEYPDDLKLLLTLGYLYIQNAQFTEAVDNFNKAILIHPDNFQGESSDIDQLIQQGQVQEALEYVEDLLTDQNDRFDLMLKRADLLSMTGATSDALMQYEQVVRLCPDFLEATIKLGTNYLQTEKLQSAAQQFNRGLEINDRIVDAYIGLAIAQLLHGHKDQALTTLSLAAAIQPNSSVLFVEFAKLQFQMSSDQNAISTQNPEADHIMEAVITAHKRKAENQPDNPDIFYKLGLLMMNVSRMKDAVKCFQRAVQLNPMYHRAKSKLAIALYETNQKNKALEIISSKQPLKKSILQLHYKTALLYCNKLKFAGSMLNLNQHLQKKLANEDTAVNISIVLQNLGLIDRAAAMWDSVQSIAKQTMF